MVNTNNIFMQKILVGLTAVILILGACKKTEDMDKPGRLFRPVVKEPLESGGNWIKASWQAVKGASSYTAEVSADTFRTVITVINTDTNSIFFEDLAWDKLYQVQVRANATDTAFSSKISYLGEIKTARFPTILNVPALSEVNDNSVKVSWITGGAEVTNIQILLGSDSSVVTDVALTPTDVSNEYRIISGLNSTTSYIIYLYSGTTLRGWADFTTKAALTGNIIDLRGISGRPSVLADTIPIIASGSTIVLKRGETYEITSAISLDKTLTFIGGTDLLVPDQPVIYMTNNFNIVSGSVIDSIVFIDLTLRGSDYASKYVFNINQACTIGKIRFESCLTEIFRGVARTQSQPAMIDNFEVENCIIDSIAGYGVLTVDVNTSQVNNISIRNSTIYKAEKIVTSKNNSTSLVIENCTINEAPRGGNYFIDYSTSPTNLVTQPVSFKNNIIGLGKSNSGSRDVRGYRLGAGSSMDVSGTYSTSDFLSTNATGQIPSVITYTRPSTEIWQDPYNGNFQIIDNTFPGRNNSGDPRWRP